MVEVLTNMSADDWVWDWSDNKLPPSSFLLMGEGGLDSGNDTLASGDMGREPWAIGDMGMGTAGPGAGDTGLELVSWRVILGLAPVTASL